MTSSPKTQAASTEVDEPLDLLVTLTMRASLRGLSALLSDHAYHREKKDAKGLELIDLQVESDRLGCAGDPGCGEAEHAAE